VLRQELTAFHGTLDFQIEVVNGSVDVVLQALLMEDMRAVRKRNRHSIGEGAVADLANGVRVLTHYLLLSLLHHGFVPNLNQNILGYLVTLSDYHLRLGHLLHLLVVSEFGLDLS